jgi:probable F420-dependent oxidoreductase
MRASSGARPGCGIFLPLAGLDWSSLRARAALVERLGYDALWLDDHFWFPGAPDEDHLEVWTALSALAMATRRLTLGPLVLCQSYRSPGLVAKMAASLAAVSSGRLVLGLGAGWMEEEYRAYGIDLPTPRERIDQLGEYLEVLRRLWSDERASFDGRYHGLVEAPCRPKPDRLPIILGGAGERLLALVARYADGWNCPNPAWRELAHKRSVLERHCAAIGRDPSEIEVSEQVLVVVGRSPAEVRRERERAEQKLGGFARFDGDCHVGTPAEVAEALLARLELGVRAFAVMFGDFGSDDQIELFATEVLPLLGAAARQT